MAENTRSRAGHEPLRIRLSEERHARALERELGDLDGLDRHRLDGHWEVTIDGRLGAKVMVRVLNAVSSVLSGEVAESAVVFLDGREYQLRGD